MDKTLMFGLELEQQEGFEFKVRFDWPDVPELLLDEPEPLGRRAGPNAARLVAAAVANCLSASLVFCLRTLAERFGAMPHQDRCLEQFEDFCVVTQSIRAGIPVSVSVVDAEGKVLAGAIA
jgi:hypothetical protein